MLLETQYFPNVKHVVCFLVMNSKLSLSKVCIEELNLTMQNKAQMVSTLQTKAFLVHYFTLTGSLIFLGVQPESVS